MNNSINILNRNMISISGLKSIIYAGDEMCEFWTNLGKIKIQGSNLEILKLDLQDETIVLTGTFFGINY